MNTFVLFLTMCGKLILVSATGAAGAVVGPPDWVSQDPVAHAKFLELVADGIEVSKRVVELTDITNGICT